MVGVGRRREGGQMVGVGRRREGGEGRRTDGWSGKEEGGRRKVVIYCDYSHRNVAAMLSVVTVPRRLVGCVQSARRETRPSRRPQWALCISVHTGEGGKGLSHCNGRCAYLCTRGRELRGYLTTMGAVHICAHGGGR